MAAPIHKVLTIVIGKVAANMKEQDIGPVAGYQVAVKRAVQSAGEKDADNVQFTDVAEDDAILVSMLPDKADARNTQPEAIPSFDNDLTIMTKSFMSASMSASKVITGVGDAFAMCTDMLKTSNIILRGEHTVDVVAGEEGETKVNQHQHM